MSAKTLTRSQGLRAVGSKQRSQKSVLCNPYNAAWPHVESGNLLSVLERYLKSLDIEDLKSRRVVGLNQVTRALDHGQLSLVLVDRSTPWQLHRHLLPLSAVRGCPAAAVDGLAALTASHLNLTRAAAIGFKVECSDEEMIKEMISLIPPVEIPWLEFASSFQSNDSNETLPNSTDDEVDEKCANGTVSEVQESNSSSSTLNNSSVSTINVNTPKIAESSSDKYSHLYVMKSQNKTEETEKRAEFGADFMQFEQESDSDSDGFSIWDNDESCSVSHQNRRPSLISRNVQRTSHGKSQYRSIKVGKIQPREHKQKGGKKLKT